MRVDYLWALHYSEELECGHKIDLPILDYKGRWNDSTVRRRCPDCQATLSAAYETIIDNTIEDVRIESKYAHILDSLHKKP